ncbi:MAG: hypothetical protein KJ063_22405 [Anaerolineae bacterium]|nr:hypothetical protein [Anaerolineae bacterium]
MIKATTLFYLWQGRKKVTIAIFLMLLVLSLYTWRFLASQDTTNPWVHFPIYQNTLIADSVVIDWPLVAWENWSTLPNPGTILLKNLESNELWDLGDDFPCPPIGTNRGDLALHGEWLVGVFSCNYPHSYEIYALNLSSREVISILPPPGLPPDQLFAAEPTIYGEIIVWQQETWNISHSNLFLFNLQTRTTTTVTEPDSPFVDVHPELYQDWLAWYRRHPGTGERFIRLYNLSSSEPITIPITAGSQTWVSLDDQYVVWDDWRNGDADIYGFDLNSRQEIPIITGPGHQSRAVIRGGVIIYQQSGSTASLWVYHLHTQQDFHLFSPTTGGIKRPLALDNGVAVWINSDTGSNTTVYGARQLPERFYLPLLGRP